MSKRSHPKVVVIGAGSLFFGRQAIWQMVYSPHLRGGTLALVDTDAANLGRMAALARKLVAHEKSPLTIEASDKAADVLRDADFVVLSFADRSARFRDIDCRVAAKYGVRMCSGDTIGPGGIFRTLREFPVIVRYAREIEKLCPEAWVINYINPTATHGLGLRLYAPKLKSFALCDGLHMPRVKTGYAKRAGLVATDAEWTAEMDRRFDFRIAGPNHFTWLLKADYDGRDMAPVIAENLRLKAAAETDGGDTGAKARHNDAIGYELYELFGRIPTCVGHTKEYVRFWQGLGRTPERIPPLEIWNVEERYQRHADMWKQVEGFIDGKTPMAQYKAALGPDHATDIIEAMWAGLPRPFFINTANRGSVPNMPDDAFLELLCDVSMDGPKPRPVGPAPVGLRGLWQQVLDSHELAARAAIEGDRDLLLRAFLCDPMVSCPADSRAMIAELLEAERDVLPSYWGQVR